jgi:hypothetical protein
MLMMHERRRQHLMREREKRAIVEAGHDPGILDEIGDLLDERRVFLQVHTSTQAACMRLELARNPIAALVVAEHDEVLRQARLILIEAADLDRPSGPATRCEKPVAIGQRPGFHVQHLRPGGIGRPADRNGTTRPP